MAKGVFIPIMVPTTITVSSSTSITAVGYNWTALQEVPVANLRPPEDHPAYQLIGRVAAEWSLLEHLLDRAIWAMVGGPHIGGPITAQLMGAMPRYNALLAQLRQRPQVEPKWSKLIDAVNKLIGATHGPQTKRNRIVHDPWFIDQRAEAKTVQLQTYPRNDTRFGINEVDFQAIQETIAEIQHLTSKAEQLWRDVAEACGIVSAQSTIKPAELP